VLLDSSGEALDFPAGAVPHVLKINAEELAGMIGTPVTDAEGAAAAGRAALGRGPELVLVTMGAVGAVAVSARSCLRARCAPVDAAGTVGAGDAFTAGFLARRGEGLRSALAFAAACGAAQAAAGRIGRLEAGGAAEAGRGVEVSEI
jgi:fructose-1-phosphate kinase PfkB-like protein